MSKDSLLQCMHEAAAKHGLVIFFFSETKDFFIKLQEFC